jgi:amino acid adenylation domain-containing protein
MKDFSQRIAALGPEQRRVFELLRKGGRKKAAAPAPPGPVPRRREDEPCLLSFDQERLWFLFYLDPESSAYNIDNTVRMRGPLDVAALHAALNEVVRRHEAWRTCFAAVLGQPVQVVAPRLHLPLPVVDLTALPAARREPLALALAVAEFRRPFDLARLPLVRAHLVRTAADEHLCLLTVHHIVTDWISFQRFWRELAALYEAYGAGRPSPLPALPVQYADFAIWQRRWLDGETLRYYLDFWLQELADAPQVLALPTDRPRPATQTTRGRAAFVAVPPHRAEALRALSRREGATPFMGVLAAFSALLHRYGGQEKILVGSPNANRNRVEIEGLLGFFLTQLVFATDLAGDPGFRELLHRERATALAAYAHQDLPFGKLVEALRPERDASRAPLVQVNLLLLDPEYTPLALPGLTITPLKLDDGVSRFDMTLGLWDGADGITGWFEYNTDLWDHATLIHMAEAFQSLVEQAVAAPDARLSALPLLSAAARHQLLVEWNDTAAPAMLAMLETVDRAFAAQAAATPEAVAIVSPFPGDSGGDLAVTYAELDRRANRLAHLLRRMGVGPESRVGLCLERTTDLAAAMLGVWRAGGAWVPLDPGHPEERLALLVADAGVEVVLSRSGLAGARLAGGAAQPALLDLDGLDEAAALAAAPATEPDERRAAAGDLAYVLYTSGSTGRPKGVMVEHGNLANLLAAARREFGWSAEDRMPVVAPSSFDIFLFELWSPLLAGGTAELVPLAPALDLERLRAALGRATRLHAVPALLAQLVDLAAREGRRWDGVRTVFVGGDAVHADLLAGIARAFPAAAVRVLYGPTEGTILAASARGGGRGRVGTPLGRPLANVDLRVYDGAGALALPGVPGEILIGGAGVTRGYLGLPERTAERYPVLDGRRFFRTGDRGRWLADGSLEFLGRMDRQVKVRGFRVEPGEVEAALATHPAVRAAAVVARPVAGGDRRLLAFVAGDATAEELRAFLARRLPEPMVPGRIVALAALPLTAHGKVDRGALLALAADAAGAPGEADLAPPRGPIETVLAGIWAGVLGREQVGAHDNFFRLGGDSILSIQVVARARQAGLALTPRQLFENQTVAALALVATPAAPVTPVADAGGPPAAGAAAAPFALAGLAPEALAALRAARPAAGDAYPLAPLQQGMLFRALFAPAGEHYFEQLTCTLDGDLDRDAFRAALQQVVDRHPALATAFVWEGPDGEHQPLQVVEIGVEVPWTLADWRRTPAAALPERLRAWLAADRARGFDLGRPPLLRAALLQTGEAEHRFVWSFHHLLFDGWCLSLLIGELFQLYAACRRGAPPPVLPFPRPYRDYVAWLAGRDRAAEEAHWRARLAGFGAPTPVPLDVPGAAAAGDDPAGPREERLALPPAATAALAAFARRQRLTLGTVAQAAWAALLARYGGGRDVVFGTVVSGRPPELPGVESMVGLFINTLPARFDVAPRAAVADWLAAAQRAQLELRAHEWSPLADVQRWSEVPAGEPLFHSLFVFENAPVAAAAALEAGALAVRDVELADRTDYPLTVTAIPGPELALAIGHDRRATAVTARRLLGHLAALLDAIAADPGRPVGDLPLLAAAERHQLVVEWNDPPGAAAADRRLDRLFLAQAARTPAAPALVADGQEISYGALARRAAQLARALAARGVGPGTRVALCLERSLDMVAAVLGILLSGGAYVPLEPETPRERLAFFLADARPAALVTRERLLPALPELPAGTAVLALAALGEGDGDAAALPDPGASPDDLAYVIYTSGSTGTPKGVMVSHRAVAAYALAVAARYGLGPGERMLQFASIAFDASAEEIFAALLTGATLVVHTGALEEPARFLARCGEEGSTVLSLPTAWWHQLAAAIDGEGLAPPASLRLVVTGGERALPERWAAWRRGAAARVRLLNCYGPTEATIGAMLYEGEMAAGRPEVPIGRPLPGVRAHVLDAADGEPRPVPVGGVGELYLGGAGLARGYLDRPAATAAAFVPDPFAALAGEPGARLYRTGDLARHLPDGALEFAGRVDGQVKVRGFRVELGEVEAALAAHPGVRAAAAVARPDGAGSLALAAYVVPLAAGDPLADLASFLVRRLPGYMVPADLVPVAELPLTATGKLDRQALARLAPPPRSGGFVAPRNPVEERLAAIWSELLGARAVGVDDDFFALGGHSLLATQLVSRLRREFQVDLALPRLFELRRLGELAEEVLERRLAAEGGDLDDMLAHIDELSDEEAMALLAAEDAARPAVRGRE